MRVTEPPCHDVIWDLPLCWWCCSAYSPSEHLLGCNIPASFRVRRLMAGKHLGCKVNRLRSMQALRSFTHAHVLTMIRETCASAQTIDCSFCGAYAVRVVISMTGIRNSQLEAILARADRHRPVTVDLILYLVLACEPRQHRRRGSHSHPEDRLRLPASAVNLCPCALYAADGWKHCPAELRQPPNDGQGDHTRQFVDWDISSARRSKAGFWSGQRESPGPQDPVVRRG